MEGRRRRTRAGLPHIQRDAIVGRDRELAQVLAFVEGDQHRLITVTGRGGVGKSSLALHVAGIVASTGGCAVTVVPLAAVLDPHSVLDEIADARGGVGSRTPRRARGPRGRPPAESGRALRWCADGVELAASSPPSVVAILNLVAAAYVAGAVGDDQFAARLYGAVQDTVAQFRAAIQPARAARHEEEVARLRAALGPRFDELARAGAALSWGEALDEAVSFLGRHHRPAPPPRRAASTRLTPRERDVLQFLAVGMSNKEIGSRLTLTPKTVITRAPSTASSACGDAPEPPSGRSTTTRLAKKRDAESRFRTMDIALGIGGSTIDEVVANAEKAAAAGFTSAWLANIFGVDAMMGAAIAGRTVPGIRIGTAVVPIGPRHPHALAQAAMTAWDATDGRFTLGIGVSHQIVIESMFGLSFDKPAKQMREYLAVLLPLLREGNVSHDGELYRVHAPLERGRDGSPDVLLAAMAPAMLRLAGEVADGTLLWMTGAKTVSNHVAPRICGAAESAGRPSPRIVCSLPVAVTDDPDSARETAASTFAIYGTLPSYRAMLDAEGAEGPGDVALVGDEETVAARIRELSEAGVTEFSASCFGDGETMRRTIEVLRGLAV